MSLNPASNGTRSMPTSATFRAKLNRVIVKPEATSAAP